MFIRFDVIHERDKRTDRWTLRDSKDCAYASHRAVKSTNTTLHNEPYAEMSSAAYCKVVFVLFLS